MVAGTQQSKPDMNMPNMNAPAIPPPILPGSTHIVRLQEAVTMEELSNDEEYNDIMEDMQEECAKVWTVLLHFLLQVCRFQMEGLLMAVFSFTSLQIPNGSAVDSEAPRAVASEAPGYELSDLQGHSDLVLTCFQTRRAGLKLKSYQKCMFVASFTRSCAVSVAFVSVPGTLCQCNVMLQISVQHHT